MNGANIFFGTDDGLTDILIFTEIFEVCIIIDNDIAIVIEKIL